MSQIPIPSHSPAGDSPSQRVRRCRKCGGEMRCKTVINFRINGGDGGQDFTFVCAGCRHYVTELSTGRTVYLITLIVSGIGLGGVLVVFGVDMLVDLVTDGPSGNDLSALIVVIVLFLGLGLPFFLVSLWSARSLIQDRRELQRNPIVR